MSQRARKEASRWLLRLQSGSIDAADRDAFKTWYTADARNAAAFDALTDTVGRVRALSARLVSETPARRRTVNPSRRSILAATAGGALAAGFVAFAWVAIAPPQRSDSLAYETELGAQRKITLADGSNVEMNTGTRIDVRMSPTRRQIDLQRGEALFDVAHDAKRPFEVEASGHLLRAVGTVFSVRVDAQAAMLTVMEGAVAVVPPGGQSPVFVIASERFDLAAGVRTRLLDAKEIARSLAWRQGMLDFSDVPLGEIVEEVERYTGAQFSFAAPELADLRMAAYFRAADLDGFLSLIERSYPLLSVRRTGGGYLIYRRPEATR